MKRIKFFLLIVMLVVSVFNRSFIVQANSESESKEELNWELTWEDNFEGTKLDEEKWNYDTGNGHDAGIPGWGNEELQNYQKDNVSVEDGKLIIEARKEETSDEHGNYDYTSGLINTQNKFSQKYGKFEARMKLPEGKGYWPAFWMMPEDDVYGGWARSGEIDIMEAAGAKNNIIGGALHYGGESPNNTFTAKDYVFPEGEKTSNFNTYSVEWEPGEIRWYVNDVLFQTLDNWHATDVDNAAKYSFPAPFDQEFHLILNLAVGGWYDGNPDETTEFPAQMEVDYVRAYKLDEYKEATEPSFDVENLPNDAKEAINGNYIYDQAFDNGFTEIKNNSDIETIWTNEYWNFLTLDEFGGQGNITTEKIEGRNYAKVAIEKPGSQTHSIQMIQNVTLGKGRWYKLSFDAKSNIDRSMNVKIGSGEEKGWTVYSPNMTYQLSEDMERYEMMFQMQHESDSLARLEMNLGTNDNSVWIGNVKLEETEASDPYNEHSNKTPLKNGNHVYNGTFDQGRIDRMTFWDFVEDSATATPSVIGAAREMMIDINDGGNTHDSLQLIQHGINIQANHDYALTFKARADDVRSLNVEISNEDGSTIMMEKDVELTTEMSSNTIEFTAAEITDAGSKLKFNVGGEDGKIYLDDVSLIRTSEAKKLSLNEIFPLRNGEFHDELSNWSTHIQGDYDGYGSSALIDADNKIVEANVENVGENPWDIQLFQNDLKLVGKETYIVEFDANSNIEREIEVIVENEHNHRYFEELVRLNKDMRTYTFEFTMDSDDLTGLKFLLGNVNDNNIDKDHQILIDNIKLEVKNKRKTHLPLQNGGFSEKLSHWENHIQGDHDGHGSKASIDVIDEVLNILVDNVGYNPWDIQITQNDLELTDKTYVVYFDAKSDKTRLIEVIAENANYYRYFEETVEINEKIETYKFEFDMTDNDIVDFKFLLGNVGPDELKKSHNILIDNVHLEVKGAREHLYGDTNDVPSEDIPLIPLEPSTPIDPEEDTPLIPLEPSTPIDPEEDIPLIPIEPSTPIDPDEDLPLIPLEPATKIEGESDEEKSDLPGTGIGPSSLIMSGLAIAGLGLVLKKASKVKD